MPQTGFNRTRVRYRTNIVPTGSDYYYVKDFSGAVSTGSSVAYGASRSVAERCRDYTYELSHLLPTDPAKLALASGKNDSKNADRGGDFEVTRRTRYWQEGGGSTTKLVFLDDIYRDEYTQSGQWLASLRSDQVIPTLQVGLPEFGEDPLALNSYWGPIFFDRANPVAPKVNLATFAGELMQSVPTLPLQMFRRLQPIKDMGSEILNLEFGWLPFFADIRKSVQILNNVDKTLRQLARDSDKGIRRRMELHSESEILESISGRTFLTGPRDSRFFPEVGSIPNADYSHEVKLTKRVWGSGRFRYHLGPYKPLNLTKQQLRVVTGLELTPRAVWELMPWSWLIDWASNAGAIISNLVSAQEDAFVADYAYVMGSITRETTTNYTPSYYPSRVNGETGALSTTSCRLRTVDEYKARYGATPYGFGLNPVDFSSRKWDILAALGLSRFNPK